jgi:hypothetical protein
VKVKLIYAIALFVLTTANLWAQALGTVVGTVTDQNGAVVPEATVTIINEGTQFSRTALRFSEAGAFGSPIDRCRHHHG